MELTSEALAALEGGARGRSAAAAGGGDDDGGSVMSESSSLADYLMGGSPRMQGVEPPLSPMQQPLNGLEALGEPDGGAGGGAGAGGVGASARRSDAKMLYL